MINEGAYNIPRWLPSNSFPPTWRSGVDITYALDLHPISNRVNFYSFPDRLIGESKWLEYCQPPIARSVGTEM